MEKVFALFLGISFGLIALFGFSVASATMNDAHVGCVADVFQKLQGSACPVTENPFALLALHLGSLKSFVGAAGATFLAVLILLALVLFSERTVLGFLALAPSRLALAATPRVPAKRIRWIALHETSPTGTY